MSSSRKKFTSPLRAVPHPRKSQVSTELQWLMRAVAVVISKPTSVTAGHTNADDPYFVLRNVGNATGALPQKKSKCPDLHKSIYCGSPQTPLLMTKPPVSFISSAFSPFCWQWGRSLTTTSRNMSAVHHFRSVYASRYALPSCRVRNPGTFCRTRSYSSSNGRLPNNPLRLHTDSATVHLLGTMHIAEASANAARRLIIHEHGKGTLGAVFLELDSARFARMKKSQSPDESLLTHALSVLTRSDRTPIANLLELGIGSVYRFLHRLGFAGGVEFKAAIEAAEELNIPILLGDQDIQITMKRLGEGFSSDFDIPRLLSLMMSQPTSNIETNAERGLREAFQAIASGNVKGGQEKLSKLIDRDTVREIMEPMKTYAPNVTRAILHERDVVMTNNLLRYARELPENKRNMVAIVGMAHVEGIAEEWKNRQLHSEAV